MSVDHSQEVRLPGLDGMNPLGFLAAIGVLRVLDYQARLRNGPVPTMRWIEEATWFPLVRGIESIDALISTVLEDKASWSDDRAFQLAYDADGRLLDPRTDGGKVTRDLKPLPEAMCEFLDRIAGLAERRSSLIERWASRRSMDTASCWGSELIQDNNGKTKPTAFHFTAGQQRFLDAAAKLQSGVAEEHLREALLGPWRRESTLPSMSWDSTAARSYALRATDPSGEKRGSTPGADWLATVAIGAFPSVPSGGSLRTTGVRGGWKDSAFTWPLSSSWASYPVVRSLLATARLDKIPSAERSSRGIAVVLRSAITRADQGGYGGFSPARVL